MTAGRTFRGKEGRAAADAAGWRGMGESGEEGRGEERREMKKGDEGR